MSAAIPKARKLSSFVKCGRCRQDRQKCERPEESQKCLRCAKYKHHCDAGRPSNRAQRSQRLPARVRAPRATVASSTTQSEADPGTCQEPFDLKTEESSSSRTSRSASAEQPTALLASTAHEDLQLAYFENAHRYAGRHDSAYSPQWASSSTSFDNSPSSSEYDATNGWSETEWLQRAFDNPNTSQGVESVSPHSRHITPPAAFPIAEIHMLTGLTNFRPSRHRAVTPFEERLDNRVDRLWGNYKTFASASSKGLGVTSLFGRTLSELFRQSRQMAENGDDLVADVRHACGAADACMNRKLSEKTRAQYLEAYHHYDAQANVKFRQAVEVFARKIEEDESPDVLPLYTAAFLYYAAGSCMRGADDLVKATFAFKYFNQYTAGFPIKIKVLPAVNGTWATDMLLANNSQDPGMRINTLAFALGKARLEFDRKEGLC
ncbi:hypothetical protein C7974DRAFT_401729 [Boeremia exigua]|uniref:uncharacterized protein n=1 Tax=Boeremia exigua TaxID=749465 RepID=UPI001E8E103C|nr:uncharacterized protein C7974DRAFT_401729 [Boeremia exigua]KAH6616395.1 hypothetical protein C7974DRAFT_401729 [Boeremia exigua]